jgi:glutathione S-transferase
MQFYGARASGNAYKVRILLALLRVPYESVLLDFAQGEHKSPEFLRLNPRGEVPVIEDEGAVNSA